MPSVLFRNIEVIDSRSPLHRQKLDLQLVDGCLLEPQKADTPAIEVSGEGLCLSKGWFDLRAQLCQPGFEHKDTLETLAAAAHAGGFTDVATLPNTFPVIEEPSAIAFLKQQAESLPVHLHPMATATKGGQGHEMNELIELQMAGAAAFTDGLQYLASAAVLRRLLLYGQHRDSLLILYPEDTTLAEHGQVHEGYYSTLTGMRGIPEMAEAVALRRDLAILAYTGGRLHFGGISTAEGVAIIRRAKAEGLAVTADVAVANLALTDEAISQFDTNAKVKPPLRSLQDQEALWAGLADGTIDCIVSQHSPQDTESKILEFGLADYGMLGLETAFGLLQTHNRGRLSSESLIDKLTDAPRQVLGLQLPPIDYGVALPFTVFSQTHSWEVRPSDIKSLSQNTPFIGHKLQGRALGTVCRGHWQPIKM